MSWDSAWGDALARLELDTTRAEMLLVAGRVGAIAAEEPVAALAAWSPPALGLIPTDMIERARLVLARQTQVAARLAAAVAENRQLSSLVTQSRSAPPPRTPVFVDQQV